MRIDSRIFRLGLFLLASASSLTSTARAQDPPELVGVGDSSSEGVQSADASLLTQPWTYLNWIAFKMNAQFPLPFISSGPLGWVGQTGSRFRFDSSVASLNLAVSGADVDDLLNRRADATTPAEIDSETDLVLFPRRGSQMEIVESLAPSFVICWIGANDALGAVTSWDHLNASQLTSEASFRARFREIGDRLSALGSKVVFLNIPDASSIAFAIDGDDLVHFLGSDHGLPPGYRTSLVALFLLRLGLADGSLFQQPDLVLDHDELALVSDRISAFNQIIDDVAADIGAPVVDIHALMGSIAASPPRIFGIRMGRRLLRGVFSLDGVHPSNTAHAIIADLTIRVMNEHYGTSIPRLTLWELLTVFLLEPHLDKDGDGRVQGRPLAGLLETLGPSLGISGDWNDLDPSIKGPSSTPVDARSRKKLMEALELALGRLR